MSTRVKHCLCYGPLVALGVGVVLQFQPWSHTVRPLGPVTVQQQKERLIEEELALGRELRTHRMIAKMRHGTLPDFEEEARRNPDLADYKRRADDHTRRKDEFEKTHPEVRW